MNHTTFVKLRVKQQQSDFVGILNPPAILAFIKERPDPVSGQQETGDDVTFDGRE